MYAKKKKKKVAKKKVTRVVTKTTKKKKVAKKTKRVVAVKKTKKVVKKTAKLKKPRVSKSVVVEEVPVIPEADVVVTEPVVIELPPSVPTTSTKKTKAPRRATSTKTTGNYLSKGELMKAVLESKAQGKMSNDLALKLQLLSMRLSKHPWYARYTYIDDMQAYALMMLVRTWNKFDPAKSSNPFAFYTQCIKNSFQQYKLYEKRQRVAKDRLLVDQGLTPSYSYQSQYDTELRHQLEEEHEGRERYRRETQQESDESSENE